MTYFNYIITNNVNNKQYVGAHSTNNLINDKYLGSGKLIQRAIKKYGKENFTRDVLNRTTTFKEALYNERFLIEMYNTLIPNGYNISPTGGNGIYEFTKETKNKIGKKNKIKGRIKIYKNNQNKTIYPENKQKYFDEGWNLGISEDIKEKFRNRKLSKETKRKISETEIGRIVSEETKEKQRKVRKGKTYEELFGEEKANKYKQNLSKALIGNTNYKGNKKKLVKKEEIP